MKFLGGVMILSGMIIGVGMFGIPFSFVKSGFVLGSIELLVLAGIVMLLHLLYGEIVLATPEPHRFPGYVRAYCGRAAVFLSRFSTFFGISGTLLAYLILGSYFLHTIFSLVWISPGEFFWTAIIFVFGSLITFFPPKQEAVVNGALTAFLIVFILFLAGRLFPYIDVSNLTGFHPQNIFIPYGILIFSLAGGAVIPDLIAFLGRERRTARRAIAVGSLIPAFIYFVFAFAVVGASGGAVSEEAIRGLHPMVGDAIVLWGSMIGFLAVFTSLIVLSSSFQTMFELDFGFAPRRAWMFGSALPFLLYLLGFKNFIVIIAAVGAIAGGIDALLIIYTHARMNKLRGGRPFRFSYIWKWSLAIIFVAGAAQEVYAMIAL